MRGLCFTYIPHPHNLSQPPLLNSFRRTNVEACHHNQITLCAFVGGAALTRGVRSARLPHVCPTRRLPRGCWRDLTAPRLFARAPAFAASAARRAAGAARDSVRARSRFRGADLFMGLSIKHKLLPPRHGACGAADMAAWRAAHIGGWINGTDRWRRNPPRQNIFNSIVGQASLA